MSNFFDQFAKTQDKAIATRANPVAARRKRKPASEFDKIVQEFIAAGKEDTTPKVDPVKEAQRRTGPSAFRNTVTPKDTRSASQAREQNNPGSYEAMVRTGRKMLPAKMSDEDERDFRSAVWILSKETEGGPEAAKELVKRWRTDKEAVRAEVAKYKQDRPVKELYGIAEPKVPNEIVAGQPNPVADAFAAVDTINPFSTALRITGMDKKLQELGEGGLEMLANADFSQLPQIGQFNTGGFMNPAPGSKTGTGEAIKMGAGLPLEMAADLGRMSDDSLPPIRRLHAAAALAGNVATMDFAALRAIPGVNKILGALSKQRQALKAAGLITDEAADRVDDIARQLDEFVPQEAKNYDPGVVPDLKAGLDEVPPAPPPTNQLNPTQKPSPSAGEDGFSGGKKEPITVFHGSPTGGWLDFDDAMKGTRMGRDPQDVAYHFSDSFDTAKQYSQTPGASRTGIRNPSEGVMQTQITLNNPKVINEFWVPLADDIAAARAAGHDGFIIKDPATGRAEYVVFDKAQIGADRKWMSPDGSDFTKTKEPWEMTRAEGEVAGTAKILNSIGNKPPKFAGFDGKTGSSAIKAVGSQDGAVDDVGTIVADSHPVDGVALSLGRGAAGRGETILRILTESYTSATGKSAIAHNAGDWKYHGYTKDFAKWLGLGKPGSTVTIPARSKPGKYTKAEVQKAYHAVHRNTVEQALRDGKPVPPEVLADYPDLAAKYPPANQAVPPGKQVEGAAPTAPTSPALAPDVPKASADAVPIHKADPTFGANNKITTRSRLEEALAELNGSGPGVAGSGLGGLDDVGRKFNAVVDVAAFYVEAGVREIPELVKALRAAIGPNVSDDDIMRAAKKATGQAEDVPPAKPPKVVAESGVPDEPVKATGLANQVQAKEAAAGSIDEIAASAGKSAEEWQKIGKAAVDDGADFDSLARKIASGDTPFSGEGFGILLEGKRVKMAEINRLLARLAEDPTNRELAGKIEAAREDLQDYLKLVQEGKGRWSDAGRALQAGTTINEGDFVEVLTEAERYGKTASERLQKKLEAETAKVAERDAKIAELEAGAPAARAEELVKANRASPRANKVQIQNNIARNRKALSEAWAKSGVKGGKTRGAAGINPDIAPILRELATDYVKLGVANLDDVVKKIQQVFKEETGESISPQEIIDSIGAQGPTKTRSDIQKEIDKLRRDARSQSTATKAKRDAAYDAKVQGIKDQIDKLKEDIASGNYVRTTKRKGTVDEQLETLRAERDVYAAKVRAMIRDHNTSTGAKIARTAGGAIRGTILGGDVGQLTRQGLFAWARPREAFSALGKAAKATFSEVEARKAMTLMNEKRVNGKLAAVDRKKAGLSLTDYAGPHAEELSITALLKAIPGLKSLGGALERFQHVFINQIRTDTFDRALKLGYSPDELKARAQFINSATGRSNLKNVHPLAEVVFTSPRYEASRWEMLAQPLKSGFGTLRGNRGARDNMVQMAVTAAEVYGIFRVAELAGYSVDYDPASSDFLKMRKGDEVYDVSAGLAPRLKDIIGLVYTVENPGFVNNLNKSGGKALGRALSPVIKTPGQAISTQRQLAQGKKEIVNMFTGFKEDEIPGLMEFAPLIIQSFYKTLEAEGLEKAAGAAAREFVGGSVNRYPKKRKKGGGDPLAPP